MKLYRHRETPEVMVCAATLTVPVLTHTQFEPGDYAVLVVRPQTMLFPVEISVTFLKKSVFEEKFEAMTGDLRTR